MSSEQPSAARYKIILVVIVVALTVTGTAFRLWKANNSKKALAQVYPQVERLVAIYSLLNWRKPEQQPPIVEEDSEWGSRVFTLQCDEVQWGTGGLVKPGELFSCFTETVTHSIPEDNVEVEGPRLTPNEDYWYKFRWESLFGYELEVLVGGEGSGDRAAYSLRDSIVEETREACGDDCSSHIYIIRLSGISSTRSVTFLAADGHLSWDSAGNWNWNKGWVIYLDGEEPVTAGQINKVVQLAARSLKIKETDLAKVAPELEMLWMSKDAAFLDALFTEIDKVPDLTKLASFLKGK